ncbi:DeoR/GlpR family DNA-binding transcription regulator [Ensifer soli]|uniref:DeoR/GlpR family DNA-binding transcription regulator n=1 Tax=Ciceribacter sp. sgz301302 TaxID=3342379 RepID=UPI0035B86981
MLAIERRQKILARVDRDGSVTVADLSLAFGVTEETIRRDLQGLDREGLLSRTHGGAVARARETEDLPYPLRQTTNIAAKRAIAALAVAEIAEGDAVMVDSSSTAYEVLPLLARFRDLTLVTNSVRIVAEPTVTAHPIMSVGGELRRQSMTFVGPLATGAIGQFSADVALISCKALARDGGVLDASLADAEVKRAFIGAARKVCLLVDGDKFGGSALTRVCGLDRIDVVLTDRMPGGDWPSLLARAGARLRVAEDGDV